MIKPTIVLLGALVAGSAFAQEPRRAEPAGKPAAATAEASKGSWTGFITDTHCGKKGANADHTPECVMKCLRGGSKAQIWNEADQQIHDLDSFEKVKTFVGKRVTVKGSLDPATNTIRVESAEKAPPKK